VKSISCGDDFACALLENNRVKCWGDNSVGQLGLGDTWDRDTEYRGSGTINNISSLPYVDLGDVSVHLD
jgi:alpha-tubulin suppressor-like RCC1 family protein